MNAKKMFSPILTLDSQHPMIRARNGSSNLMLSSQIKDNLCIICKYKVHSGWQKCIFVNSNSW